VNEEYFSLRANLFGYKDDHVRFALLSKAALEWLLYQKKHDFWMPDVIHCNDWHTGYFIEMARRDKRYKEVLKNIPIVLTIHNFHYQGNYDFRFQKIRDDGSKVLEHLLSPKMQKQNPLLRGILYADGVTVVKL
jgi:starch synthase